ncbi:MAG: serine/threonine-protein kinase [Vulcanimicrobiota bacterium]
MKARLAALCLLSLWFLAGHPLDTWAFDNFLRVRQSYAPPVSPHIALLDIDAEQLKEWPGTRQEYDGLADLISRLRQQGARVIALDLILARGEKADFTKFWEQVVDHPDIVLGRTLTEQTQLPEGLARPTEGLLYLQTDSDGVIRRYNWGNPPSLALACYLNLRGIPSLEEDFDQTGRAWKRAIPAQVWLDERAPWTEESPRNFVHVTPKQLRQWEGDKPHLSGKVVLINYSSGGSGDLGTTPLARSVPKVYVHALALNGLLQDAWFRPFGLVANLMVALALVVGAATRRPLQIVFSAGWILFCLLLPHKTNWFPPIGSIALGWSACLFLEHWQADRTKHSRLIQLQKLADSEDPLILKIVGDFQVVRKLGAGGFAAVYQAVPTTSLDSSRSVALKIVHPGSAESEDFRRRFQREVRISSQLKHPSIVRVYGSGQSHGLLYMSMELLEGRPLRHYAPEGQPLSEQQVLSLLKPMLEALEYAHGQSVVHRDLKPENMMVKVDSVTPPWRFSELKIVDFGLAFDSEASALTKTGEVFGTLDYMSPERIQGSNDDPRSDLFAVGAIAYELLAGKNPFKHENPGQAILMRLTQDPPPLPGNSTLCAVVMRLLARDPAERPQTARQVLDELGI